MTQLDCKILTQESDIAAIGDEWRQLYARCGRTPYSDYDLHNLWWRIIGKGRPSLTPYVIVGRENGKLSGVLAMMVVRRKGVRVLQMAGSGSFAADMVAESEAQAAQLWQCARRSPFYDFASIRDVYPESLCYAALSVFAQKRDTKDTYVLRSDWANGAEWIASMPSRVNHDPQRRARRLAEKGPVKFEIYKDGPVPRDIVKSMVLMKRAWTVENEKQGLFDHPQILDYFYAFTENAARKGELFLSWLTCDGKIIAYDQGFVHNGVLRNFTITHDPEWSNYSPGILILRNSVSWAIDNGVKYFHHGQGYGNYKANYSNEIGHCDEFTFNGSVRGGIIETGFFTLRAVSRNLKERKAALKQKIKA